MQWWFKEFCKGDKSLEKCSGPPSEGDNDQLRAIIKADLLTTTREVAKVVEEHSTALPILLSFGIWSKLERWKNSVSGCLMSWQEIFLKSHLFEISSSLILCKNKEPFLYQIVTCDEKWILHYIWQWLAQWLDQEAPKHFPKSNQIKVMVTVWWAVAHLIQYSFLNPSETITSEKHPQQINEMHQNCTAYSWHWSTKRGPILYYNTCTAHHTTNASKVEWIELWSFASSTIFIWSLTNHLFFKHLDNFSPGRHFHNQQNAENAFQELIKSPSPDFYAKVIYKCISHWQNCVDCNCYHFG